MKPGCSSSPSKLLLQQGQAKVERLGLKLQGELKHQAEKLTQLASFPESDPENSLFFAKTPRSRSGSASSTDCAPKISPAHEPSVEVLDPSPLELEARASNHRTSELVLIRPREQITTQSSDRNDDESVGKTTDLERLIEANAGLEAKLKQLEEYYEDRLFAERQRSEQLESELIEVKHRMDVLVGLEETQEGLFYAWTPSRRGSCSSTGTGSGLESEQEEHDKIWAEVKAEADASDASKVEPGVTRARDLYGSESLKPPVRFVPSWLLSQEYVPSMLTNVRTIPTMLPA